MSVFLNRVNGSPQGE